MDHQTSFNIPQEVVDYVVDFLHDDKLSLFHCALLSSAWLESSRYHLFRIIRIRIHSSHNIEQLLTSFTLFFNRNPLISRLVHKLLIARGEWKFDLIDEASVLADLTYPKIELYLIAALLRSLPRISAFSMDGIGLLWNSHISETMDSRRPSFQLQELNLRRIFLPIPPQIDPDWPFSHFLSWFSSLKLLSLRGGMPSGSHIDGGTVASSVSSDALHKVRATRVEVLMTDHNLLRLLYATIVPSNLTSCLLTVNEVADAIDVQSVLNGTAAQISTLELSFVEFVPIGLILRNGFEDCVTINLDLCRSLETLHLGLTLFEDHDLWNAFVWASIFTTVSTLRSSTLRLVINIFLHRDISKPLAVLQRLDWLRLATALRGVNATSATICLSDRSGESAWHASLDESAAFIEQMLPERRENGVLCVQHATIPSAPVRWYL
ncbi:unnamed protein product [Somion occarium]|uniref:F-box domain-containing protein n=1 Tax=Somion occarium TaxID=3059160 RepID=A0ABP1DRG9_9APHY